MPDIKFDDFNKYVTLSYLNLDEGELGLTFDLPNTSYKFDLRFKRVKERPDGKPSQICESCPYKRICRYIPYPLDISEEAYHKYRFCDFCLRIGDVGGTPICNELRKSYPKKGSIEGISSLYLSVVSYLCKIEPEITSIQEEGKDQDISEQVRQIMANPIFRTKDGKPKY